MAQLITDIDVLPIFAIKPPRTPWGINFGGGTNSWAMALACHERWLKPDWCIFADTGSETPETYDSVGQFAAWCAANGWPFEIVKWIRKDGSFESIHENCLRTNYLPSRAYQLAGCTSKWKVQPMQKWRKLHGFENSSVAIGYDSGERVRLENASRRYCSDPEIDISQELPWYPLAAWGIDRDGCHAINERHGVTVGKSACFCCPNMTLSEWEELKATHPDLYSICEQIEHKALDAGNVKGKEISLFKSVHRNNKRLCQCFLESGGDSELPENSLFG